MDNNMTFDFNLSLARNCQMLWMKNPEICLGCNL